MAQRVKEKHQVMYSVSAEKGIFSETNYRSTESGKATGTLQFLSSNVSFINLQDL